MLTQFLKSLGDPADVRSIAAIVAGVLVTVFHPANSANVVTAVDAGAALVVAIDTLFLRKSSTGSKNPPKSPPASA